MHIRCFKSSTFSSNVYAIEELETRNVWLIDAGYSEELMQYLSKCIYLKGIFLTHIHYDHICGLNDIIAKFPNISIWGHVKSSEYLCNPEKNLSLFFESPLSFKGNIKGIRNGEKIRLKENIYLEIIETPGHHPTCITYQFENSLFTGDSYIPMRNIVTHLPEGDKIQAEKSKEKILKIKENGFTIYPGHTLN